MAIADTLDPFESHLGRPPLRQIHPSGPSSEVITPAPLTPQQDKTLPLPRWLERVYFIFPIVLYVPDVIFNYFVYSDGGKIPTGNPLLQVSQVMLWAFMAVGVVGMAYLLSVLAPWHWGRGHRVQAIFCGLGVIVATAITTWNSLAYRSTGFQTFPTDKWVDGLFPNLQGISLTMVLVAIAPPFWGLFWAVVQPTQGNRSLRHLQESHEERLLRLKQDAEVKRLRAEANAQVRAAQLKGMAATAATARDQAAQLLRRGKTDSGPIQVTEIHTDRAVVPASSHWNSHLEPPALPPASLAVPQQHPQSSAKGDDDGEMDDEPAIRPLSAAASSNGAASAADESGMRAAVDQSAPSRRRKTRQSIAQLTSD